MAVSFAGIGAAFLIAAVSPSFAGVIATATLIGLGDGVLNLQSNSLVGELHPVRRVAVLNWANAAFGLGAISTPLLGTLFSWRIVFTLVASLALVSVALVWQAPPVKYLSPGGSIKLWRRASIFLLMIMVYTGLEGALGTWSSTYLLSLAHNETLTKTWLSLYWGGLTLGRIFLGNWVGKQPLKFLPLLLVSALGVLGICLIPSLAILFPLAAFFYGPLFATLFALVQESCGHVALGYLFYAAFIGKTSVPAAFSLIESPAYLPYGFIFLALLLYILSLRLEGYLKDSKRSHKL
jgi:MFS family permease